MSAPSIVISAPFGNYIQPQGATVTLGTFTLQPRPGRWRQVVRTVRYHRSLQSWTNRIGLRNPGIRSLEGARGRYFEDKIISVHGFNELEWEALARVCIGLSRPLAFELNVSCPNVTDDPVHYDDVFARFAGFGCGLIVKLPPIRYEGIMSAALAVGASLHCCNTLPVPAGGMSGQVLKPLALDVVRAARAASNAWIIGGGGVSTYDDYAEYRDAGADQVAVGSALFNPWFATRGIRRLIADTSPA